jgi:hypothetical protein
MRHDRIAAPVFLSASNGCAASIAGLHRPCGCDEVVSALSIASAVRRFNGVAQDLAPRHPQTSCNRTALRWLDREQTRATLVSQASISTVTTYGKENSNEKNQNQRASRAVARLGSGAMHEARNPD